MDTEPAHDRDPEQAGVLLLSDAACGSGAGLVARSLAVAFREILAGLAGAGSSPGASLFAS